LLNDHDGMGKDTMKSNEGQKKNIKWWSMRVNSQTTWNPNKIYSKKKNSMLTRLNHIPTTQPYLHWFAISAYKVKSESDISKLTMPVFSLSNLSSLYSSVPLPSQEIPMILRLKRLTNSHCIINNYLFPMSLMFNKKIKKIKKKKQNKEIKEKEKKVITSSMTVYLLVHKSK
jgi:hypothetical protein